MRVQSPTKSEIGKYSPSDGVTQEVSQDMTQTDHQM